MTCAFYTRDQTKRLFRNTFSDTPVLATVSPICRVLPMTSKFFTTALSVTFCYCKISASCLENDRSPPLDSREECGRFSGAICLEKQCRPPIARVSSKTLRASLNFVFQKGSNKLYAILEVETMFSATEMYWHYVNHTAWWRFKKSHFKVSLQLD